MTHTIPRVEQGLVIRDGQLPIAVGTAAWYEWLAIATSFTYISDIGTFTAQKERFQRGGWYWKAYRRRHGTLRRAYLGKSEHLTNERLHTIARHLGGHSDSHADLSAPSVDSPKAPERQARLQTERREPLLTTKMHIPAIGAGLVQRSRLIERLCRLPQQRLTVITAPAGYGKTTLLSEWATLGEEAIAWLTLDNHDNDSARFWRYLLASLDTALPDTPFQATAALQDSPHSSTDAIVTLLINDLTKLQRPLVVVLDDYHCIHNTAIHDAMSRLIDNAPRVFHLMIASREAPPLPLSRWRVRDQLSEIFANELCFTLAEAHVFFHATRKLDLDSATISLLSERTEGWIAGLQLAALSLQGREQSAKATEFFHLTHDRSISEYLLSEVLQRQPSDICDFLLETSILEQLCGPLCEAVTGRTGAQNMLEHMERAGLFVRPLDNERKWYRYHHLFAEFLRDHYRTHFPERVPRGHLCATQWFADQGLLADAIRHALAAKAYQIALHYMELTCESVIQRGELITLLEWLEQLPEDVIVESPRLCLAHGRALITQGNLTKACERLDLAERAASNLPTDIYHAVLGESAASRSEILTMQGNLQQAGEYAQRALALLPEQASFLRSSAAASLGTISVSLGDMEQGIAAYTLACEISAKAGDLPAVVGSLSCQGHLELVQGRLPAAATSFRNALQAAAYLDPSPPLACLAEVGMGMALYEWNLLDAAHEHLIRAKELGTQRGDIVVLLQSLAVLARIALAQGDRLSANRLIEHIEHMAKSARSLTLVARILAMCADLWVLNGMLDRASLWAKTSGLQVEGQLSYGREVEYLAFARVLVAQSQWEEAAQLLKRMLEYAETAGRGERVIKIRVLQTLHWQLQGSTHQAVTALTHALILGQSGGYVRTFLDAGVVLEPLLAKLMRDVRKKPATLARKIALEPLKHLLAAFPPPAREREAPQGRCRLPNGEELSEREQMILRLITSGRSNQEIANELVIELSTVVWHVKHIFDKLDVHSRTQAINQAHSWNIFASSLQNPYF